MPTFTYKTRNAAGRSQKGTQSAESATALAQELRGRGLLVLDVQPTAKQRSVGSVLLWLWPGTWLPARHIDIELSLQQLSVMLRSGLTLLTALRSVSEFAIRQSMSRIWQEIAEKIQRGSTLGDAMAQHRRFPHLVVQLVRVGEQTGTLDSVVNRAAGMLERSRGLRAHVLTALMYPTIVFIAAIGVASFMIVGVIPKLGVFLKALGKKLPPMTQALLDFSDFVQVYGLWILGGVLLLICVSIAIYLWPPGRLGIDRILLRLPVVGHLLRLSATVQFAHGLGVLLTSGITLVEGLRTVEEMSRNRFVRIKVNRARLAVLRGSSLAEPLTGDTFQPMLSRMVAVGESSGNLDDVLGEVASFHEQQLQGAIKRLSVLVEPAIVVIVGGIVGFVYIAFFMALFAAAGGSR